MTSCSSFFSICLFILLSYPSPSALPVAPAGSLRERSDTADEKTPAFLYKMAAGRMAAIKEGNVAIQRGSAPAIREYARKMIKDNYNLTAKIRRLAETHGIDIPNAIPDDRRKPLADLEKWSESDFDIKFSNLMIANHERDIKDFREAVQLTDLDVSDFALKYISVLQTNLAEIKAIRAQLR